MESFKINPSINSSIFKAYDIRGFYPQDVTTDVVTTVAKALPKIFHKDFNKGEHVIIVAHDGRHGGPELAEAILRELQKISLKNPAFIVKFLGLTTTPMFYFFVNHLKATGGFMITASHNPKEYNGLKIVGEGAMMISGKDVLASIQK